MQDTLTRFLSLHYKSDTGLYSYIQTYCRSGQTYQSISQSGKVVNKQRGMKPYRYMKVTENGVQAQELLLHPYDDYYVTANGFSVSDVRNNSKLFTLHNIVIDLDCHNAQIDKKELSMMIQSFRFFLEEEAADALFVAPNSIVETGRGVQLWWSIYPLSAKKCKHLYNGMRDFLINRIQNILSAHHSLSEFTLDANASSNYVGLFRLPGSYNTKSKSYSKLTIIHDTKLDVLEWIPSLIEQGYQCCPKKKIKSNQKAQRFTYHNLYRSREQMIYKLLEHRGSLVGFRDLSCLILYNAYLSCGQEENKAKEAVLKLNSLFDAPLPEHTLLGYLSSSTQKKYSFSNQKIIEILGITPEEQKLLNFYSVEQKKRVVQQKRNIKETRNNTIVQLFLSGKTQEVIASLTHCSQATVSRIINKYGKKKALMFKKIKEIIQQKKNRIHNRLEGDFPRQTIHTVKNYIQTCAKRNFLIIHKIKSGPSLFRAQIKEPQLIKKVQKPWLIKQVVLN